MRTLSDVVWESITQSVSQSNNQSDNHDDDERQTAPYVASESKAHSKGA